MARMETKSIQVAPADEQRTIELYEKFGWTCKSSQTIESSRSYLERDERDRDVINQVTEKSTYVKLVFSRDRDMDYYREIVECEQAYQNHLANKPYKSILGSLLMKVGIGIVLLGGVCIFVAKGVLVGLLFVAVGTGMVYLGGRRNAKRSDDIARWERKANRILKDASMYI